MNTQVLAQLIGGGPLLLDFDGPVCSIFAGHPAASVAAELVSIHQASGVWVPPEIRNERDPLAVLRWTGETVPRLTVAVEDALCAAELNAVATAVPTPYGREAILAARAAGLSVAIVSNNSAGAINAYLATHNLADYVTHVVGRAYAQPSLMKPSPVPILTALDRLGALPSGSKLIGDSRFDIDAARAAGIGIIGYANRSSKVRALADADAVITTMAEVVEAL